MSCIGRTRSEGLFDSRAAISVWILERDLANVQFSKSFYSTLQATLAARIAYSTRSLRRGYVSWVRRRLVVERLLERRVLSSIEKPRLPLRCSPLALPPRRSPCRCCCRHLLFPLTVHPAAAQTDNEEYRLAAGYE